MNKVNRTNGITLMKLSLMASVFFLTTTLLVSGAIEPITATRDISDLTVSPGDTFTVSVNINSYKDGLMALSLKEDLPDGWTIISQDSFAPLFKPDTNEWVWMSYFNSGSSENVIYSVTVPEDAGAKTYFINGSASAIDGLNQTAVNVSGDCGVTVVAPPVADFYANITEGSAPLSVQFTDNSTGSPTYWTWDFGDESPLNSSQNPVHIYEIPGTYGVNLTAVNDQGSNSEEKPAYITVYEPIFINESTPSNDKVITPYGTARTFTINTNYGADCNITWSIDGSEVANGSLSYTSAADVATGSHTVTVVVSSEKYGTAQQSWNWIVYSPVSIINFLPEGSQETVEGNSPTFSIEANQPCNISWYLNDSLVKESAKNVVSDSYENTALSPGVYSVTAIANNSYDFAQKSWVWTIFPHLNILDSSPEGLQLSSLVNSPQSFNIRTNQSCNVSWLLNGINVYSESDTSSSTYIGSQAASGYYTVEAVAENRFEELKRTWTWKVLDYVSIDNKYPESDPVTLEGSSPTFSIGANQNCTISWYINGTVVKTAGNVAFDTYKDNSVSPGTYNVTAVSDNGYDSEQASWTWTILPHLEVSSFSPEREHQYSVVNKPQEFSVGINQIGNISWFLNDTEVKSDTGVTSSAYNNESAGIGNYTVKAVVETDFETVNQTWAWTVVDAFAIMADSPENDPVSAAGSEQAFRIDTNQPCNVIWKVNGEEVRSETSVDFSEYSASKSVPGTYLVEAFAENEFGTDSISWTWTVVEALEISNFAPVSDPVTANGTVQSFSIDVNRPCDVNWYLDGSEVAEAVNSLSYMSAGIVGEHNVTAAVFNATTSEALSHTWTWTVVEALEIVASSPEEEPLTVEGTTQEFSIETNRLCDVSWYLNGNEVSGAAGSSTYVPVGIYSADPYNVTVLVSNSTTDETISCSWTWIVVEALEISDFAPVSDPVTANGSEQSFSIDVNRPCAVKWFLDGSEITEAVNSLSYLSAGDVGVHNVTVFAANAPTDESCTHRWTWTVFEPVSILDMSVADSVSVEGDAPEFRIDVNQPCSIEWYLNGTLVDSASNAVSDTYQDNSVSPGTYNVTAVSDNGYDSKQASWTWTILPHLEVSSFSPERAHQYSVVNKPQEFSVGINQIGNISWFLNDTEVKSDIDVTSSAYNNESTGIGNYTVKAVVETDFETVNQTWAWTVVDAFAIMADSPESDPVSAAGSEQAFRIDTNQPCNVIWKVNGEEVRSETSVDFSEYSASKSVPGTYLVEAFAENEFGTDSTSWTWIVVEALEISNFVPVSDPVTANGTVQSFSIDVNRPCDVNWYLNGSEVAEAANSLSYMSAGIVGEHNVTVAVSNATTGETLSHTWTWNVIETLEIVASSPEDETLTVEGATQEFSIETNRLCDVSWYLNGNEVSGAAGSRTYAPVGVYSADPYNVTVLVSNSTTNEKVTRMWNWTVVEKLEITEHLPLENSFSISNKEQTFSVETNRLCDISWWINGELKQPSVQGNSSLFSWNFNSIGVYEVMASSRNVTDPIPVNYTWTWTVVPPLAITPSPAGDFGIFDNESLLLNLESNRLCDIVWLINGSAVQWNSDVRSVNFDRYLAIGCHNLTAIASNNTEKVPYTWNLTIQKPVENTEVLETGSVTEDLNNGSATFDFTNESSFAEDFINNSCIQTLVINTSTGTKVEVSVLILNGTSSIAGEVKPLGAVYQNLDIWLEGNGVGNLDAVIKFKVDKAWLTEYNVDPSRVVLARFHADEWEYIRAEIVNEDGAYLYFEAHMEGFSPYVIGSDLIKNVNPDGDPVLSVEGDAQEFSAVSASACNFTWYIDSLTYKHESGVSSTTFTNSTSAVGLHNVTVVAENIEGTSRYTWNWIVTEKTTPEKSGSSSGGSVSIPVSGEPAENVATKAFSQRYVTNGNRVTYNFQAVDVTEISFDPKRSAGQVIVRVESLKGPSAQASGSPEGEVYRYMNVLVGKPGFACPENIENLLISFKVSKEWLNENRMDESMIRLNRYSEDRWTALSTDVTREDENFFYFEAESPGLSVFAITCSDLQEIELILPENETDSTSATDSEEIKEENAMNSEDTTESGDERAPGFELIAGLIGLLVSVVFIKRDKL